jgi:hypothetical protein
VERTSAGLPVDAGGSNPAGRPGVHDGVRREHLLLALILVLAAAVRLIGIGDQSFSIDEIHELRIASSDFLRIVTFGDGFPPLYNLLFHLVVPLGDLAGRVLSVLFGVATVVVVWGWARRIAGAAAGCCAAWFVALAPLAVQLSGEGRAYALMTLLAAISLWALWAALDDPSASRWVRWGLVSALGVYTHYLFAVLVAAWLVVALIEVRGRVERGMWLGIGVLGALSAPAVALLAGDVGPQMGLGSDTGLQLSEAAYAGYRLIAGFFLGPSARDLHGAGLVGAIKAAWVWVVVLAPLVGLLLVQGYRALGRVTRRRLLAVSVLGLLLESVAMKASGVGFGVRYLLWLVVPLSVWLGAGLVHLRPGWRRASAAVLLAVAAVSVVAGKLDPHHQGEDARAVADYLQSSGALQHPVLVLGPDMVRPIVYYIERTVALALPDDWDPDVGQLAYYPNGQLGFVGIPKLADGEFGLADALQLIDVHVRPGEPYHLVYARPFYWDHHGELLEALGARDGLLLVRSFAGMEVFQGVRCG